MDVFLYDVAKVIVWKLAVTSPFSSVVTWPLDSNR